MTGPGSEIDPGWDAGRRFSGGSGYGDSPIRLDTTPSGESEIDPELQGPGLSFERDIQPLSKRMFRQAFSTIRNPLTAAAAFADSSAGLKQAYVQNAQIRALDEASNTRRIQYESAVFSLESARDKARKDREMLSSFAPIQAELSAVMDDPSLTTDQRTKAVGSLAIQHAGSLSTNPAVATAFSYARNSITEDKKKFTAYQYMAGGGDAGFLVEMEKRLGRPLTPDDTIPLTEAAVWSENSRTNKATAKLKLEKEEKAAEDDRQNLTHLIRGVSSVRIKDTPVYDAKAGEGPPDIEFENPASGVELGVLIDRFGTPTEIAEAKKSRRQLLATAAKISGELLTNPASRQPSARIDPRAKASALGD